MAMTREEIRRRIRDLINQAKGVDSRANAAVGEALGQAHNDLLRQIAGLPENASSYARYQLQELRRACERAMEEFDRRLASAVKAAQADSFGQARENVDATLRDAVGAPASLADLSRTQLLVAQDYSADLVRGLSQAGRDRLNSTLSRAFLGGQSVTDIIKEIGRTIGDGQFGIITRRAETIYRTEVLRMQSIATQARLEQAVERGVPGAEDVGACGRAGARAHVSRSDKSPGGSGERIFCRQRAEWRRLDVSPGSRGRRRRHSELRLPDVSLGGRLREVRGADNASLTDSGTGVSPVNSARPRWPCHRRQGQWQKKKRKRR